MASLQKKHFSTDSFKAGSGLRSFISDVMGLSEFPCELLALVAFKLNAN